MTRERAWSKDFSIDKVFDSNTAIENGLRIGTVVFFADTLIGLRNLVTEGRPIYTGRYKGIESSNYMKIYTYNTYYGRSELTFARYVYVYVPNLMYFTPSYPWTRYVGKSVAFIDAPDNVFIICDRNIEDGKVMISTPRGYKSAEELSKTLQFVFLKADPKPFGYKLTPCTSKYIKIHNKGEKNV